MEITATQLARFNVYINKSDSGCWMWTASKDRQGYGFFRLNRRLMLAHRVGYELANGPIPMGLLVMHTCDNPACVRPSHLVLGTHADNMRDKVKKGRQARHGGGHNPRAKLTWPLVVGIRTARSTGESVRSIAARLRMSRMAIYRIVSRESWPVEP